VTTQTEPSADSGLRAYLLPGEQVLWQGKPEIRSYMLRGAWYMIPFSLLWGGFAIFWEASALVRGAPPFFLLFGIPFLLIGLYMIFGRFYVAAREAENTMYAITDGRVLILSGAFRTSLVELDIDRLPSVELNEGRNGIGSITFGPMGGFLRVPPGWPTFGFYAIPPAFQSIRDVRTVFDKLQQARADLRAATGKAR